jgi:hypothetical protein
MRHEVESRSERAGMGTNFAAGREFARAFASLRFSRSKEPNGAFRPTFARSRSSGLDKIPSFGMIQWMLVQSTSLGVQ